jgi:hypothetical protein
MDLHDEVFLQFYCFWLYQDVMYRIYLFIYLFILLISLILIKCVNSLHDLLVVQGVPLATEPGISLIILTPMKILQRNLNRGTFVV